MGDDRGRLIYMADFRPIVLVPIADDRVDADAIVEWSNLARAMGPAELEAATEAVHAWQAARTARPA